MSYRPEIDGLRAVAVVPVILFHGGISGFSGGFVGVDVFFVISGYLITSILLREMGQGRFSLWRFWERRARRILPALVLVMVCCIPFAWMWMLPDQYLAFSRSLIAVSVFASNILFWRESGYFAAAAEEKPLLHTWSLAVEEQFYILFPLAVLLIWRLGRRALIAAIALAGLLSLGLSQYAAHASPAANFYLLPTRAWELMAGALCALALDRRGVPGSDALAGLGLALILGAVVVFDGATPFPSVWALVPVGGTVLIVLFARPGGSVARGLSWRPVVAVGLISYSAYLWHQPLFAFARVRSLGVPDTWLMLGLAVLSLGLAALSWRLVEQPFRLGPVPWLPRRRQIFAAAGIAGAVFIGIGAFGHATQGAAFRIDMPEPLHASLHDRAFEAACFNRAPGDDAPVRDWFCTPAALDGPARDRRVAVIGDSHALSYLPGLVAGLADHGIGVAFSGVAGCPPLKDTFIYRSDHLRAVCNARNAQVFEGLRAEGVEAVILIARWAMYAHGDLPQSQRYMDTRYAVRRDKAHTLTVFVERLTATLDHLEQAGLPVWILHQPPLQAHEPSNLYARFLLQGEGPDFLRRHSLRREAHDALYAPTRAHLEAEAAPRARVATLDPADRICGEDICLIGTARQAVYIDRNHLSNPGAAPVARILANQIAARLAADRYDAHRPVACASGRNCAPDPKPDPKKDAPR